MLGGPTKKKALFWFKCMTNLLDFKDYYTIETITFPLGIVG